MQPDLHPGMYPYPPEESAQTETIFPKNIPAENVIKTVLTILQAHHQHQAERLIDMIEGRYSLLDMNKLTALWQQFKTQADTDEVALQYLTQIIATELDGHDVQPYLSNT